MKKEEIWTVYKGVLMLKSEAKEKDKKKTPVKKVIPEKKPEKK